MSLKTFLLDKPIQTAQSHFTSNDNCTAVVKGNGGVGKEFYVPWNDDLCCGVPPSVDEVQQRKELLFNLVTSYLVDAKNVPFYIEEKDRRKLSNEFKKNTDIILAELDESRISTISFKTCGKDYINGQNTSIAKWKQDINDVYAKSVKLTNEALKIREKLEGWLVENNEIDTIIKAYCQRSWNLLAKDQFTEILRKCTSVSMNDYKLQLVADSDKHIVLKEWDTRLKLFIGPDIPSLYTDFWILFQQLKDAFPTDDERNLWIHLHGGKTFPLKKLKKEEIDSLCQHLTNVAKKLLDLALKDIRTWKDSGNLKGEAVAKLLFQQ